MEKLENTLAGVMLILLAIVIIVYLFFAIFLNKFHKLVNGKGTVMAFIPIANIYLLGKLALNKLFGYLLLVGVFLQEHIQLV